MTAMGRANGFHQAGPRRGLTLVEGVISTFVVTTMVVAALYALGSSARAKRSQARWYRAGAMGRQLIAETLQAQYDEPNEPSVFGPEFSERGGSRANFDDVDDYHDWSASPPQAKDATPLVNRDGWTRQVTVEHVRISNPDVLSGSDEGLKRINVRVTDPEGRQTTFISLRSKNSIYDEEPDATRTYVAWVGVELQVGDADGTRVVSGVNLLNPVSVPDQ